MKPLQTTNELIQFAESHLPKQFVSMQRAFHEGTVENLGAFKHIYYDLSGWILKLTSKHKANYYIVIFADRLQYKVGILRNIPWKKWEGDKSDNKLYQGDKPLLYKELRDGETKRFDKDAGHTCPNS